MKPIRPKAVYTLGIRGLDDGGIEIEWRLLVEDSCSLFELHIIICILLRRSVTNVEFYFVEGRAGLRFQENVQNVFRLPGINHHTGEKFMYHDCGVLVSQSILEADQGATPNWYLNKNNWAYDCRTPRLQHVAIDGLAYKWSSQSSETCYIALLDTVQATSAPNHAFEGYQCFPKAVAVGPPGSLVWGNRVVKNKQSRLNEIFGVEGLAPQKCAPCVALAKVVCNGCPETSCAWTDAYHKPYPCCAYCRRNIPAEDGYQDGRPLMPYELTDLALPLSRRRWWSPARL